MLLFGNRLNIDSCWIGSLSCPQGLFSATVYDAIATESMLFIRQNQLMYYFKGNLTLLRSTERGSGLSLRRNCRWWKIKEKQEFVLLLGTEDLSEVPIIPMGIMLSHVNSMAYIWGNFLFSSYNHGTTWFAIPGVPPHSLIRYFTHSWNGDFIFMTDLEELWYGRDGFSRLIRLRPSRGWVTFLAMQKIKGINDHYKSETTLTVFFDRRKQLQEASMMNFGHYLYFFLFTCTSTPPVIPNLNFLSWATSTAIYYNRIQSYIAKPPWIYSSTGLYDDFSLTIYQGLLYGLFNLHSTYYRPYADPVHDPTWRWWQNSRKAQHYYFYMASNKLSKAGLYVETYDFRKKYDTLEFDRTPDIIYLDKGKWVDLAKCSCWCPPQLHHWSCAAADRVWSILLLGRLVQWSSRLLRGLQRPTPPSSCTSQAFVMDRSFYEGQSLSGEDLILVSVSIKVVNSDLACFSEFGSQVMMQGSIQLKIYVGCPPGNRLAFDIAYTLNYSISKNNVYFDCVEPDEIPCFYYQHLFYPFFLIQDMVTGDSDRFLGRYTFKVIGGGPYKKNNIKYFTQQEILLYNSVNYRKSYTSIWTTAEEKPGVEYYTNQGFLIFRSDIFGIRWICQKNSPCNDVSAEGLKGPEYFFVIEVSNRGIDTSTYCDYRLEFIIHLHGLPLNPHRGLLFMLVTLSILWFILISYVIYRCYLSWLRRKVKAGAAIDPMILPARSYAKLPNIYHRGVKASLDIHPRR
ncbi:cation channel sperm-associated protein subunit gamma [Amblyraja radiata]|uniref:cation channel sperm-associated protein subunit gamma n=1 Tax=Amblyraja radiata TaxID=386614 RepID=UPI001404175D|nr:cation channel sperm-associated protein subunit gamma [Amblyraja radiata]